MGRVRSKHRKTWINFLFGGNYRWKTRILMPKEQNFCVCVKLREINLWLLNLPSRTLVLISRVFQNHFWGLKMLMSAYHLWEFGFHRSWKGPGICIFHRELVPEHISFPKLWLFTRVNGPTGLLGRIVSSHYSSVDSHAGSCFRTFIFLLTQK